MHRKENTVFTRLVILLFIGLYLIQFCESCGRPYCLPEYLRDTAYNLLSSNSVIPPESLNVVRTTKNPLISQISGSTWYLITQELAIDTASIVNASHVFSEAAYENGPDGFCPFASAVSPTPFHSGGLKFNPKLNITQFITVTNAAPAYISFIPVKLCRVSILVAASSASCNGLLTLATGDSVYLQETQVSFVPAPLTEPRTVSTCVNCSDVIDIGLYSLSGGKYSLASLGSLTIINAQNGSDLTGGFLLSTTSVTCTMTLFAATGILSESNVEPPMVQDSNPIASGSSPRSAPIQSPVASPSMSPVAEPSPSPLPPPLNPPQSSLVPVSAPVALPAAAPILPPIGCSGEPPTAISGLNYTCASNGDWIVVGNLSVTPTIIPSFKITGTNDTIIIEGCISISNSSTAVIEIDPSLAGDIASRNGTTGSGNVLVLFESLSGCLSGKFGSIAVQCSGGSSTAPGCNPGCLKTDQQVSNRLLSALLIGGSSAECNRSGNSATGNGAGVQWWHILIAVLGSILLIGIIILVIYTNPQLRKRVFPFLKRENAANHQELD